MNTSRNTLSSAPILIRHEGHTARERSTCGWRDRLISREDAHLSPAAWAHAVDIDGAKLHYHKRSTVLRSGWKRHSEPRWRRPHRFERLDCSHSARRRPWRARTDAGPGHWHSRYRRGRLL